MRYAFHFMTMTDALALADAPGFFICLFFLLGSLANFFVFLLFTLFPFYNISFDASLDTY